MNEIKAFLFKVLNLGVLGVLAGYLIKKRMLPALRAGFRQVQEKTGHMREQVRLFLQTKEKKLNEVKRDEQNVSRLQDIVTQWKQVVEKQRVEDATVCATRRAAAADRAQKRAQRVAHKKTKTIVFARAIGNARVTLQKRFADKGAGQAYTDNVLTRVKKSLS